MHCCAKLAENSTLHFATFPLTNFNFFEMPVLHLTIFISLLLAGIFIVCFAAEAWRKKGNSTERSALLPLLEDEELPPSNNDNNNT